MPVNRPNISDRREGGHEHVGAFCSGVDRHFLAGVWWMWQRGAGGGLSEDRNRIPGSGVCVWTDAADDGIYDRIDLGMPYQSRGDDWIVGRQTIPPRCGASLYRRATDPCAPRV